jgi:hypothetical protein
MQIEQSRLAECLLFRSASVNYATLSLLVEKTDLGRRRCISALQVADLGQGNREVGRPKSARTGPQVTYDCVGTHHALCPETTNDLNLVETSRARQRPFRSRAQTRNLDRALPSLFSSPLLPSQQGPSDWSTVMDIDQSPGSIVLLRKRPLSQVDGTVRQTHKHFLRKTAKGRVVKVLREHYLRSDIPCGSLLCDTCDEFYGASLRPTLATVEQDSPRSKTERPLLSIKGRPARKGATRGHYLILDTNVVLHQVSDGRLGSFASLLGICLRTRYQTQRHFAFLICIYIPYSFGRILEAMGWRADCCCPRALYFGRWIFSRRRPSGPT